jgi:hypothetical protein
VFFPPGTVLATRWVGFLIRGIVQDKNGTIVQGAAVRVGKQLVFSNSSGVVFSRLKKGHAVTVVASPDDFAAPGQWRAVSAAQTITPVPEGSEQAFSVIVEMF